jgi:hypothetical protein
MLSSASAGNSVRSRLKQSNYEYKVLSQKFDGISSELESKTSENMSLNQENTDLKKENSLLHQELATLLLNTELGILKIKNIDRILSDHWDFSSKECHNCSFKFGFFSRHHHCRKCGYSMCSNCTLEHEMSLLTRELKEADSGFHKFKVCKKCLE